MPEAFKDPNFGVTRKGLMLKVDPTCLFVSISEVPFILFLSPTTNLSAKTQQALTRPAAFLKRAIAPALNLRPCQNERRY